MMMAPPSSSYLRYVGFLMMIIILLLFPPLTDAACDPRDKASLLSFASNFPTLNWSSSSSSDDDCCFWDGISCDDSGDRVVGLSIPDRGLRGSISPFSFQNLTFLNLSSNFISGPLPDGLLSNNLNLKIVDLSYNRFSGPLPIITSPSSSLKFLNFSSNYFNGTVLQTAGLNNLIALNISNNSLTGPIPPSLCVNSPGLLTLDLSLNDLTENIPSGFSACSNLQVLSLGFNGLTGQIPFDIGGAASLQHLSLPGNYLVGDIVETITNLTKLTTLALFGNKFTGSIPLDIGNLSLLQKLELHINRLNGTLPPSLMNCQNLQLLNLRVNFLTGNLSDFDFSKFSQLTILDLGENQFIGPLPKTIFSCKSLTAIRMATNRLSGEIPIEVLDLPLLSFLSLSNNTITNINKALNTLSTHPKLTTLILSKSFFNETMPNGPIPGFSNLKILALGGCKLFGQIPTWLSSLTNLEVIDLSQNNINGSIPIWLSMKLPNLFYLDLSNNSLTGNFPVELTSLPALSSKQVLDRVNSSYLELPVFVAPQNASYLQYNQLANLPPALYLASNLLSGDIPVEIGRMQSIQILDLSKNNFSGTIPSTLANLTNLEFLDLSYNNLSGGIPSSLRSLYFLSSFNVAHNKLQGAIPTGGQFGTFLNQTYEDNPGLCGPPLQNSCSNTTNSDSGGHGKNKKGPNKKMIVGVIVGICFGVGIIVTCLALWILSKRRILPRGDPDVFHVDMVSFNSSSGIEAPKDTSGVILFPNNAKDINNLTITDILKATEDFSQANIIGCGGFGLVYKATLANGTRLAVKKLTGDMGLIAREFKAELEALSTAQHKNLVSLQGYCVHDGSQLLIYSYMENGSLDYWLHEKTDGATRLDWPTRLKIAQGASCGLAYMHQVCEPHIVHRDIKSSNILLDDQFEAYVADFGLSRLIQPYNTHVTTELVGTLGYIPPEYSQSWIATLRGDIYSFGVVMLELLTGKRPMEVFRPKASRELVGWVQQLRLQGKLDQVLDPTLTGKGFEQEMLQVLDVACMCVNVNPLKRPTINEVVDWLHNVGPNNRIPK
ncbi:tyrosine-sulfated glycopeptide receptor 1 [Rutidosis leptorrhynchoides]|uniref:tyrosine-sulfated glycopeptide receptor 1 n=1 Tax=Rutidosis leptorrhynchoides TaxID=125765 RepID=UPI003A995B9A